MFDKNKNICHKFQFFNFLYKIYIDKNLLLAEKGKFISGLPVVPRRVFALQN